MTSEIEINIGPIASVFQPKSASLAQRKLGPTTSQNDPEFWPGDFRYDWPMILRNDWPDEVRFRHSQTIESWVSVLEASYVVFRLRPYFQNFNKRLTKSPKLYFCDTGLLCYLLGLRRKDDLAIHFAKGAIFENFVILEVMKMFFNQGKQPQIYYWRDSNQNEVDLLIQDGMHLKAVEIKAGKTINTDFFKGLQYFKKIAPEAQGILVYGGDESQKRADTTVYPVKEIHRLI